jgi:hypothetical protein
LDEGPNVKRHGFGYEMRAGPIEFKPSNLDWLGGGTLYGEIRIAPDGASVRFTKLKMDNENREHAICATARPQTDPLGFSKMPKNHPARVPDSELRPNEGFIYVIGGLIITEYAE